MAVDAGDSCIVDNGDQSIEVTRLVLAVDFAWAGYTFHVAPRAHDFASHLASIRPGEVGEVEDVQ